MERECWLRAASLSLRPSLLQRRTCWPRPSENGKGKEKKKEGPDKKSAENAETRREALELAPSAGRMPRLPCWNAALSLSHKSCGAVAVALSCSLCAFFLLTSWISHVNFSTFPNKPAQSHADSRAPPAPPHTHTQPTPAAIPQSRSAIIQSGHPSRAVLCRLDCTYCKVYRYLPWALDLFSVSHNDFTAMRALVLRNTIPPSLSQC